MSVNGHCFVEWKEEFVSQERGGRVVHYFLKDSAGESILTVVGTERSLRHMFYVVAEDYLQLCGGTTQNSIGGGFKWRSRREVVDWLTSMLSNRGRSPRKLSNPPKVSLSASEYSAPRTNVPDYNGGLARSAQGHLPDIIWSGAGWTCGKRLKHYPSFCRNGTTIEVHSFIFIMAKEDDQYLAHLEDMYEDRKGQKKVRVRWFHHNQEVIGVVPLRNLHPKEVFITPYVQVISAECVDGPAIVLTPEHYEKCLACFPPDLLGRVHLCFRQFRSNRVKPFDLSKLRGYSDQAIFSFLDHNPFSKPNSTCHSIDEEEDEDYSPRDNVKKGVKRIRGCNGRQKGRQMLAYEPSYGNLTYDFLSRNLLTRLGNASLFRLDEKIEVLCLDSGIRGCWFRCTVLQVSQKQIKVHYDDLQDEDGFGNLEEYIPAFKQALPDKLGMRCLGRPIMRPAPPPSTIQQDLALKIGDPIDAWWSDGWWEGVVIGVDDSEPDCLHVYFPSEDIYLNIQKNNLRISRDWDGDKWNDVGAKPEILLAISTTTTQETCMQPTQNLMSCHAVATSSKQNTVEDGLKDDLKHNVNEKQLPINDEDTGERANESGDMKIVGDNDGGDNIENDKEIE